ncbi:MAG: beta-glucosidase [Deferribacteres bacterium]|nr:beta-glucosidase [candidate division KSB1 bacterium]MCB9500345.1 beta-glucosidase [Deferribacteres bacterium]
MKKFPPGFVWGTATSSYQIEGAWLEGGKGLSIWDAFSHTPGKIKNHDTGDIACDHYHRFKDDVKMMADMGLHAYRFSISWPRIQPTGVGKANPEGIRFYSNLIDTLLEHNITPWITLYHWDLPLVLQFEHDGWLNPAIADYFANYAAICFEAFGDRVKHWITLNEPWCSALLGYSIGHHPPGRISRDDRYRAAHNLLRAHAFAVEKYRSHFQQKQKGIIGITNNCDWRDPLTDSDADRAAAERAVQFFLGWFADPIYKGDYPEVMREQLGKRLPQFTAKEQELITGSSDFFGLNHYSTMYAANAPIVENSAIADGMWQDQKVILSSDPSWEKTLMNWNIVPEGFRRLLQWVDQRYGSPEIYVTENGCSLNDTLENGSVNDPKRIAFFNGYLNAALGAIANNVKLKGYFAWSFMDNFEWTEGYAQRFGLHFVNYKTGERIPKASAKWFARVIQQNGLID